MRFIPLFALCALLASCDVKTAHDKQDQTTKLSVASLYNADSVKYVAAHAAGKNNAAEKVFLKAIDLYRNKKNAAGSVDLFIKSILLQPQAKSYYELGNALMDTRKVGEALSAYDMAELLDYKPLSKLLYNKACAYSISKKKDSAEYYLYAAIEFGYNNMDNILKDPDLAWVREDNYAFKSNILEAFAGAGDPEKLQWNLFAGQFKPLHMPVTIDKAYAKDLGQQFISYDFEIYVSEMRDTKFSRDVGSSFFYVGEVKKTPEYKTLIYGISDEVEDPGNLSEGMPFYYLMVSYNTSGKVLDKMLLAGQKLLNDPYRKAVISGNGDIEVTDYKIEYEKDPEKEGYKDNPETSRTELKKEVFVINEEGRFAQKTQQLAMIR
ncbi:TPR end-of-group domain-containing protein [Chitinophaga arvensicola]|uniref:Uncharacterized protein n=1 Tax=Chitinophaga arvensicola TaxID=29529 RepID=A0A1I0P5P0_9BACT|nr:hypothetical protein [Chitinophaga arvensicola]SEW09501.1 hypothetical protein SAMN04488122_0569 [Chitinophaga arvensicola]